MKLTLRDYYNDFISRTEKYKSLSFNDYKRLFERYYREVLNNIVDGNGVKLNHGLGTMIIEYKDMGNTKMSGKCIDWGATIRKKKEIEEKGLKIYNKQEAEDYAKAGIFYDGVQVLVYKDTNHLLKVLLIGSEKFPGGLLSIRPLNYFPREFIGKSYSDIMKEYSDAYLNNRRTYVLMRAEIKIMRDKINYLKYIHKMK